MLPGPSHTFGIKSENFKSGSTIIHNTALWAWGGNYNGQLGDGSTVERLSPVLIGSSQNWVAVSCGDYHSVGRLSDSVLRGWGSNSNGQLGDGTLTDSHIPKRIGNDSDWVKVTTGLYRSSAVKLDGSIWAWGRNNFGQLGDGTKVERHIPVKIFPPIRKSLSTSAINLFLLGDQ